MAISILYFDPWGQFQGQNIGRKVITLTFIQIMKMMPNLNSSVSPLIRRYFIFPDLTSSSKDMVI